MSTTYPVPPVPPPAWTSFTAPVISSTVNECIKNTKALLDEIAALPADKCTFDSVARALTVRESELDATVEPLLFLQYVSGAEDVRDAAVAGDKKLQDFGLECLTRVDIYEALTKAKENTKAGELNPEEDRLLTRMILDRTRNGLALPKDKRDELLEIKKKINNLCIDFSRNCNEEKGFLLLTREELDGVPEDVISGYPEEDGKLKITFKTPDYLPIAKSAHNPAVREKAVLGYEGKTLQNAPILAEVVELRKKAAALLSYDTWASYILEVKMAKDTKTVFAFLDDLEEKLRPIGEKERDVLLALKKEVHAEKGLPFTEGEFNLWDYRYYDRLYLEKTLSLDEEAIKAYFPVSVVVPVILDIYKKMLSVEFFEVPESEGGATWHKDAQMFAVYDTSVSTNRTEKEFLGYMHLDLFPRENKYGHAAVWGLIPGWQKSDGSRHFPTVAMVANLAKATATKPALMKHGDVVTFFHEMGHAFHSLCSNTQFGRFHGTHVSRDFVEAPSQMLEHWVWQPEQLKAMSSHFETQKPLPDEFIKSIVASKNVNQGLFNLRQLFHGKFDMAIHTDVKPGQDLSKLWCETREKTSLVSTRGQVVGGQSGFAHLVGGYDAGYYGYLYSQVFSADMFEQVFANDPMDPASGIKYRRSILQPGGSRDEMDSLVEFLGRPPTNEAFLKSLLSGQ